MPRIASDRAGRGAVGHLLAGAFAAVKGGTHALSLTKEFLQEIGRVSVLQSHIDDTIDLIRRARLVEEKRNEIVHSMWSYGADPDPRSASWLKVSGNPPSLKSAAATDRADSPLFRCEYGESRSGGRARKVSREKPGGGRRGR